MKKGKFIWYFLCVTLLISMIFIQSIHYHKYKKSREVYINKLYFHISHCIDSIQYVKRNIDHKNQLEQLNKEFMRMDALIYHGHIFLDRDINYNRWTIFNDFSNFINYGLIVDGTVTCHGFYDDGEITEAELSFFNNLENDLEDVRLKLYSEDTGQENPNLSFNQINDILIPLWNKYLTYKLKISN